MDKQQQTDINENATSEAQRQQPNEARPTVTFLGFHCNLRFEKYHNGRTAILLVDANDGQELTVATVNAPEVALKENEVLIKDYSENQGILDALSKAGIIKPTGKYIESGYVRIPVCELLVSPHHQLSNETSRPPQAGEPSNQEQEHDHEISR